MIPAGLPIPTPAPLNLVADVAPLVDEALVKLRRNAQSMTVILEVLRMTPDQVWSTFYIRGAMDPRFVGPDAVDDYLCVLSAVAGDRGHAARTGFLHGWAAHRTHVVTTPPIWHRLIGDTAIEVHPEAQR